MSTNIETTRAVALAIAPVIEARAAADAARDNRLIAASKAVADAVTQLQQSRYTAAERPARLKLERAAIALRARLNERKRT